jgi:gliding motility-associated-like protein
LVSPTVYTVTGTDGNGCVNTNTVSITVNPTPTVSISGGGGNSQTICGGGLTNNTVAGINFAVTPAGTINWTNNNTAIGIGSSGTGPISSYPAPAVTSGTSVTGIITATANSGGCPSTTNTQLTYTVIINQIPGSSTAAISPANCGVNNGTITGPTGTGGSGFYSYSWDGGATFSATSSYVNGAGTYTVEIKDNTTGCIFPQSFNIPNAGAPAAPAVTASASSICVGGTATLSITSPVAGNTYSWTPAVGSPGTGTTFTVTVGSTTPNPFTVDVTATALGCVGAATTTSITVNGLPDIPVLTAPTGTNNVYCQGSPTPLTVSSGTTTPASVAVWYSNNTVVNVGNTFTAPVGLPAGTYTFSVIDSIPAVNGCINAPQSANTVTLSVTVNPLPSIPVLTAPTGTNNSFCFGSPSPLTVNTGTNTAVWYSNNTVVNTGSIFNPPASLPAGTYTFSVIDSIPAVNGCISAPQSANTVTLTLTVIPLPSAPILTAPTGTNNSFCFGSPSPLTVNTGTNTAVWYSNNTVVNTGSIFNPPASLPAGTYTFSVIDSIPAVNGCISAPQAANTVTLTLVVNPTPTLDVGSGITKDSSLCGKPTGGISVPTANVSGGTAPYSYQWYNGSSPISGATNPTLSNVVAGTYSLHITDVNGCVANITGGPGTFSVPASAIISAAFSTTPSPPTGSVPLNVVFTNGSTGNPAGATLSYVWYFGDNSATSTATNPSHVYNAIGTYSVILVASNNGNCPDTARATVVADVATTLIIPNIFSPNGDGINDQFFINNTGMSSLTCTIFNRWGQLLFTITEPNQAWDGRTPNYMYILQAQGMDGKSYKQEGTLTLVR